METTGNVWRALDTYATSHEMCATAEIWEACWHFEPIRAPREITWRKQSDMFESAPQNSMLNRLSHPNYTRNIIWAHVTWGQCFPDLSLVKWITEENPTIHASFSYWVVQILNFILSLPFPDATPRGHDAQYSALPSAETKNAGRCTTTQP